MASQISNSKMIGISKVYQMELQEQLRIISDNILQNTHTGSVDCSERVVGDSGYEAYRKLILGATNISNSINSFIDKMINHYSSIDITDNNTLFDMLRDCEANNQTTIIADFYFNNPQLVYGLFGISQADIN